MNQTHSNNILEFLLKKNHASYWNKNCTSHENSEAEPVQQVQMNNNQTNTYIKGLSWLYFGNEPRVQDRQQVSDQQLYVPFFVADLNFLAAASSSSTSPDMTTIFHSKLCGRITEIKSNLRRKKLHRTNQGFNFSWKQF